MLDRTIGSTSLFDKKDDGLEAFVGLDILNVPGTSYWQTFGAKVGARSGTSNYLSGVNVSTPQAEQYSYGNPGDIPNRR